MKLKCERFNTSYISYLLKGCGLGSSTSAHSYQEYPFGGFALRSAGSACELLNRNYTIAGEETVSTAI